MKESNSIFQKDPGKADLEKNQAEDNTIINEHEHVVDVESFEIKKKIDEAKELFKSFSEKYQDKFDLSSPEKIEEIIAAAEKEGIFQKAQEIRELIYDKNISLYGVCYLSNKCNQNCKFCSMGQVNYKKFNTQLHLAGVKKILDKAVAEKGTKRDDYMDARVEKKLEEKLEGLEKKLKSLTLEEASNDMDAIVDVGHKEICILAGEEIGINPLLVMKYTQLALNKPGIKEVILNMVTYDEMMFRVIKKGLKIPQGVKLQHRIFQETYDRDEYAYYMERSPKQHGSKLDYDFRYKSQVAALKAGFDEVGIGALFGLSKYPLKEIAGLQQHAEFIKQQTGKEPKRCCLPLGNQPEEDHPVEIKYMIPGMENENKITELIYALTKLAMPTVSIVSSERDNPEILAVLDQYANHSTLFVHPAPGENIEALEDLEGRERKEEVIPVGQAEVYSRKPADAIRSWKQRGYNILDFDTEKYNV